MNHINVLSLINNLKILKENEYLEEFEGIGSGSNLNLLLSFIPGLSIFSTFNCIKRSKMGFFKKILFLIASPLPLMGSFIYITCILESLRESVLASKMEYAFQLLNQLMNSLIPIATQDDFKKIGEYEKNTYSKFRELKKKYPIYKKELESQMAYDYGKTYVEFVDGYINLLEILFKDRMTEDDLELLNNAKKEYKSQKIEFEKFKGM